MPAIFQKKNKNKGRTRIVPAIKIIQKSFRACGQSIDAKVEDIHCMKKDEKAEEAFASVAEFWDKDLEYFETLTTAESQLIVAEDHHDELFLIDE